MISMIYTGNPVEDAEINQMRLEEAKASRDFIVCSQCGLPIFREDEEYEGDVYYLLDGETVCEDCISDFLRKNRKVLR